MIKKICILFLFIFYNFFTTNIVASKINIIASVNNEIITNHDVVKEGKYLKILNPQLNSLENEQISELAKQSLIKEMIKIKGAVICDVVVDPNENCFPMIPSGSTHNQMLLGPNDKVDGEISEEGMVLV